MAGESRALCPSCAEPIPPDQPSCPNCAGPRWARWLSRETILIVSFIPLALLFVLTGYIVREFRAEHRQLAAEWYSRGQEELEAGRTATAIEHFRTALLYDRAQPRYQQSLAEALMAAGRDDEARAYLLTLWERQPGSGALNLGLARIAAARGRTDRAAGFYRNAIYGLWEDNADERRRQVRLEFASLLISHGQSEEAGNQLEALAAELPDNPGLHVRVGQMFVQAARYAHALEQFQKALQLDRRRPAALAGAGEAAFQLARYPEARRYLEAAVAANTFDVRSVNLMELTRNVEQMDPLQPRLYARERVRRTLAAFQHAQRLLRDCAAHQGIALEDPAAGDPMAELYRKAEKLQPEITERGLRRDADLVNNAVALAFDMVEMAAERCGPPAGADQALLLIARRHGGQER